MQVPEKDFSNVEPSDDVGRNSLIATGVQAEVAMNQRFSKPDEAAAHIATFMQWPTRHIHDDPAFLHLLSKSVARIANAIAAFEEVIMLTDSALHTSARQYLSSNVTLWDVPTDDLWCRDSGPCFVKNETERLTVANFHFNGWGNKQSHKNDRAIASAIAQRLGLPEFDTGLVGEPGGFEYDGAGTLLAHESSWVNSNRNTFSRDAIAMKLQKSLGASSVIWAPGLKGQDITDYHIDSLVRFCRPGVAIIQLPARIKRPHMWERAAYETAGILSAATTAQKSKMAVTVIPEPERPRIKSRDFVASYVNYYVCNGAVIMPEFGDKDTDTEAQRIIAQYYPDRQIVPLNIDPIGEIGGGIHCATQEKPA